MYYPLSTLDRALDTLKRQGLYQGVYVPTLIWPFRYAHSRRYSFTNAEHSAHGVFEEALEHRAKIPCTADWHGHPKWEEFESKFQSKMEEFEQKYKEIEV